MALGPLAWVGLRGFYSNRGERRGASKLSPEQGV